MKPVERRFSVAGLELAALEWPGEGLPVIALHGWLDNAASYIPLAAELQGVHLLAPDLPGHGLSEHLPAAAEYHLADTCRWVVALADTMGWDRFVLLGHSMGTGAAAITAAAVPQRVAGVIFIDGLGPLAYTPEQELVRLRRCFEQPQTVRPSRPFPDLDTAVRVRQRLGRFAIAAKAARLIAKRGMDSSQGGYRWRHDERLLLPSTHYYSNEQVRAVLAGISAPTLLIMAEEGALGQWAGFEQRKACVTRLEQQVLPGHHHLHMESPKEVATAIKQSMALWPAGEGA